MRSYFRKCWVLLQLLIVLIAFGWVSNICTYFLAPYLSNLGFLAWCGVLAALYLVAVVPFWLKADAEWGSL